MGQQPERRGAWQGMRWWETDQYVALRECDERSIDTGEAIAENRKSVVNEGISANGGNVTVGPWVIAEPESGWEPGVFGLYRDRDGDIWEKEARGWRLRLQDGVEVDPDTVWNWAEGPVFEYAPFTRWY